MEINVKLYDELYEHAKHHTLTPSEIDEICDAIKKGTPLSKGHGRLFDERDIVRGEYKVIAGKIYELDPIIEADADKR